MRFKQRKKIRDEFKFTNINERNLRLYKGLVDTYFQTAGTFFSAIIFDKQKINLEKFHDDDQFKAYNAFCSKLIAESLEAGEHIAVIADDITTPMNDDFEKDIERKVTTRCRRDALFGIVRSESHAFIELQMTDILLGSVNYAFKIRNGLIFPKRSPKLRLVKHIQKRLQIHSLSEELNINNGTTIFRVNEFRGS